jgi:hypothetical protein
MLFEQDEHRIDQLLAFEILQLTKRDLATQMIAAVRIAAWTRERALTRNLDGEIRLIAR